MHHEDLVKIRAVSRTNTMNFDLSSLGRGKMWDLKVSQPYWPRVSHISRWMTVEVRYFCQYQRVFRLLFFSVGRIVCGEGQGLANPIATSPLPLKNQDQQGQPFRGPKEHAGPSNPQIKGVFPRDTRDPSRP
jgi:hypothetical protein